MTTIDDERAIEYIGEAADESQALAVIDDDPPAPRGFTEAVTGLPTIVPKATIALAADPYVGVSAVPFDEKAQKVLAKYKDVPKEWIEIKPNGQPYLGHIYIRQIFNEAFGFGGWSIVPVGDFRIDDEPKKVSLYRAWRLYINGRYHDETISAGEYWKNNAEQNYGDAAEACKSFAINRFSKCFNIAANLWNKHWVEAWKQEYAYKDNEGKWKKKSAGDVGKPTAADSTTQGVPSVVPQQASPLSTQPATSPAPGNTATIRPVKFDGKSWRLKDSTICMYLIDSDGEKWTLAGQKLLDESENAIIDNKLLKVTYTVNGRYKNVKSVEIVK